VDSEDGDEGCARFVALENTCVAVDLKGAEGLLPFGQIGSVVPLGGIVTGVEISRRGSTDGNFGAAVLKSIGR
jgi:hypothetical protein